MRPITTTGVAVSIVAALLPWAVEGSTPESPQVDPWNSTFANYRITPALGGTASGAVDLVRQRGEASVAELVAELKIESGLTAEQLGAVFGVTRRSIHNWAAGSPLSEAREIEVRRFSKLVFGLTAGSPSERRRLLLDSSSGRSLYKQFVDDGRRAQRVLYNLPVVERFETS
jgi:hypothetical protein